MLMAQIWAREDLALLSAGTYLTDDQGTPLLIVKGQFENCPTDLLWPLNYGRRIGTRFLELEFFFWPLTVRYVPEAD